MSTDNSAHGDKTLKLRPKLRNHSPGLNTNIFELNLEDLNSFITSLEEIEKELPKANY